MSFDYAIRDHGQQQSHHAAVGNHSSDLMVQFSTADAVHYAPPGTEAVSANLNTSRTGDIAPFVDKLGEAKAKLDMFKASMESHQQAVKSDDESGAAGFNSVDTSIPNS